MMYYCSVAGITVVFGILRFSSFAYAKITPFYVLSKTLEFTSVEKKMHYFSDTVAPEKILQQYHA